MNKTNKVSHAVLYVSLLAFIVFTLYILYLNQEVFYTAHDRSEFLYGAPFFHTLLSKPFGLMQYVGAWLTQLFYKPALGAGVMVAIWVLIYFVGVKAFRLKGNASALMLLPIACLLTSVVPGIFLAYSPILCWGGLACFSFYALRFPKKLAGMSFWAFSPSSLSLTSAEIYYIRISESTMSCWQDSPVSKIRWTQVHISPPPSGCLVQSP